MSAYFFPLAVFVTASLPFSFRKGASTCVYQPPPGQISMTFEVSFTPKNDSVSTGWRYWSRARSFSVRWGIARTTRSLASVSAGVAAAAGAVAAGAVAVAPGAAAGCVVAHDSAAH